MDTKPICPSCGKALPANAPKGLCPECLMRGAFPTGTDTSGHGPRFVPPTTEELAKHFPALEIIELIGRGGMGAVYKARQKQLDRLVALKILPPQAAEGPGFAERFTREARALAKLNHPHIVTLYEFGQADGLFYFLMEYVDGVNLRQLLEGGRVASKEALAIVPQICEALQFAHERGIVHRDIKPENVLLGRDGQVKIADFGVAKIMAHEGRAGSPLPAAGAQGTTPPAGELTGAGNILGTPQYMAPEQVANPLEVDHRADIYSLGVVFYQMLTGELPAGKFEPPSHKVVVDVRLDEVVLRALEKRPELRYQKASQVREDVETIAGTSSPPPVKERELLDLTGFTVFQSMEALKLARLSALGFLGFLGFLGDINGWSPLRCLFGLFGLFGLIGIAYLVEARARTKGLIPPASTSPGEPNTLLSIFAAIMAGSSGVLGLVTFLNWPNPSPILVVSIFVTALVGIGLGLVKRKSSFGKQAIAIGCVNASLWVVIGIAVQFVLVSGSAIAQIHYAVYEMDADMVDRMIPLQIRQNGVMNGVEPSLAAVQTVMAATNRIYHWTDSQRVQWTPQMQFEFENEMSARGAKNGGLLAEDTKIVDHWPIGASVGLGYANGVNGSVAGGSMGFLGVRRSRQGLLTRIECDIHHLAPDLRDGLIQSRVLYEGPMPTNDELAFLVPFNKNNGQTSYLVLEFDYAGPGVEPPHQPMPDWYTDSNFPRGDSIAITRVRRSDADIEVQGHYELKSANSAVLALRASSSQTPADQRSETITPISRGSGNFDLFFGPVVNGLPHVSMYDEDGQPFAEVYIATKAQADSITGFSEKNFARNYFGTDVRIDKLSSSDTDTNSAGFWKAEGWKHWELHQFDVATEKFLQACLLAPKDADAWNGLGWAEFDSGDTHRAADAFQRAVKLNPDLPAALNGLGQILLLQRKYDEAEKYLLKAAPMAPAAWYGLARLYLLQGNYDQAQRWAQDIIDSGQAHDEMVDKILQAAEDKNLPEGLRMAIEPPLAGRPPAN